MAYRKVRFPADRYKVCAVFARGKGSVIGRICLASGNPGIRSTNILGARRNREIGLRIRDFLHGLITTCGETLYQRRVKRIGAHGMNQDASEWRDQGRGEVIRRNIASGPLPEDFRIDDEAGCAFGSNRIAGFCQRNLLAADTEKFSQAGQSGVRGPDLANTRNKELQDLLLSVTGAAFPEAAVRDAPAGKGRSLRENSFSVVAGPIGMPHFATGAAGFP